MYASRQITSVLLGSLYILCLASRKRRASCMSGIRGGKVKSFSTRKVLRTSILGTRATTENVGRSFRQQAQADREASRRRQEDLEGAS